MCREDQINYERISQLEVRIMHKESVIPDRNNALNGINLNNLTVSICQPLYRSLTLVNNPICQHCDAKVKYPLLPWIIGQKFQDEEKRIVFVGKPHRGIPGNILPSRFIDPTDTIPYLWGRKWPYWSYTREIAENIYGPNAIDHIAFTNIIKCTNTEDDEKITTDMTTHSMANNCILNLGVIWKEIAFLKPTKIVFYTFDLFADMLRDIPVAIPGTTHNITSQYFTKKCGEKNLHWWERRCSSSWTSDLQILITGHPERMKRNDYITLLTGWLK